MQWSDSNALNFSQHLQGILNPTLSLSEVNSILERMTSSNDSVQIAILHQQLVVHATCVGVVGGGSFQSQTMNMYAHRHKDQECYRFRFPSCVAMYFSKLTGAHRTDNTSV